MLSPYRIEPHFLWHVVTAKHRDGGLLGVHNRVKQTSKQLSIFVTLTASPSHWPPPRYGGVFLRRFYCVVLWSVNVFRPYQSVHDVRQPIACVRGNLPEIRFERLPWRVRQLSGAPLPRRLFWKAALELDGVFVPWSTSPRLPHVLSVSLTLRRKPAWTCPPEKCQKSEWAWQRKEDRRWAFSCCSEAEVNNSMDYCCDVSLMQATCLAGL